LNHWFDFVSRLKPTILLSSSICDPSTFSTSNVNFLVQWSNDDFKIFLHLLESDVLEVHDADFEVSLFSKFTILH
jgi:hypothetical protein